MCAFLLIKTNLFFSLFYHYHSSHWIWRGLAPQNKPELQKVMEKRKRDQVIKQQKEEEAQKKKSDLEIELLKRQQKLEQVRWGITLPYTSASELLSLHTRRKGQLLFGTLPLIKHRHLFERKSIHTLQWQICCHLLYRNCIWCLPCSNESCPRQQEYVENWPCLTI